MKSVLAVALLSSLFVACSGERQENQAAEYAEGEVQADAVAPEEINIHPISHASFVLTHDDITIYNDPTGGAGAYERFGEPDIILISDIHGDHMNIETLVALHHDEVILVMPQAVADKLPDSLKTTAHILANGSSAQVKGVGIEAIPMYNLPEAEDSRHPKGRGNGYVLTLGEKRVYIAGDTEDIPEMRSLQHIDMAFVPMNLPYTMPVDQAADGVLAFAPHVVYPYHYRGKGGLSDVEQFKNLVESSGKDIEVRLVDWYPNMD